MDSARNLAGIDVISSPYLPPYMALLRSGSQMVVIDIRSEEQKARDEEARKPKPWFWCLHYTKSKKDAINWAKREARRTDNTMLVSYQYKPQGRGAWTVIEKRTCPDAMFRKKMIFIYANGRVRAFK